MWVRTAGRVVLAWSALAAVLLLGACGTEVPAPVSAADDVVVDERVDAGAVAGGTSDIDTLRRRATEAVRAQRIHAPAGDNAVEHYLALRERSPDDATPALVELLPYLVITAEQALAGRELDEVRRQLALVERVDPAAPALPRLRDGLAEAERAMAEAEAAARVEAEVIGEARARAEMAEVAEVEARELARRDEEVSRPTPVPRREPPPEPAVVAAATPRMPRLVDDAAPRYPMMARSRGIEGRVTLAFTIEPDGSVSSIRVVSARPAGVFDDAARDAAERWRFEPGKHQVTTTRTLNFSLSRDG